MSFFKYLSKVLGLYSAPTQALKYIHVPYAEKDTAKALGAKWDPMKKSWYIPHDIDQQIFQRWIFPKHENLKADYFYLATTSKECYRCKRTTSISAIALPEGYQSYEELVSDDMEDADLLEEHEAFGFVKNDHPSILSYIWYLSDDARTEIMKNVKNYHFCTNYYKSSCEHCAVPQGDNHSIVEFDSPFRPVNQQDFLKINFQKIDTPISIGASQWGIGYPPLEYYLGDKTVNGMLYLSNTTKFVSSLY